MEPRAEAVDEQGLEHQAELGAGLGAFGFALNVKARGGKVASDPERRGVVCVRDQLLSIDVVGSEETGSVVILDGLSWPGALGFTEATLN